MTLQLKVRDLLDLISVENGDVGFMTCAVYDTAWVSMVAKTTESGRRWLFPECFHYIIDTQQPDGGWPAYAADVDGILNTAASLLALKAHQKNPYQITEYLIGELKQRIASAIQSLQRQLQAWDVEKAVHVGFEILVPTLLMLLEEQEISFDFPGRDLLMKLNQTKLSQFKLAYLYSPVKTTALHSLEAFAGKLDYDKVRHHKTFGAYMASPSSTAACLMYSSTWDDESEEYLRWTLAKGAGRGSGGVPSAFPSPYFEVTWVLTTLLEGGFTIEDIGEARAIEFATFLRNSMDQQNGRLGFAPSVGVDVDDTAKALLTLSLLGHPAPHQGLLDEFEVETHFRTYERERNPSFTANCNVLVALLSQPEVSTLAPQIIKVASFLSKEWWESKGAIDDKWNLSEFYPSMLMAEAFSTLLKVWDRGDLSDVPKALITDQIIVSLYQVLARTLMAQNTNGSWGSSNSREVTAYATLTISKASILPFLAPLETRIRSAIAAAQAFLHSTKEAEPSHLWVEKVSYGSIVLAESYVLAALNASSKTQSSLTSKATSLVTVPATDVQQLSRTCFQSPPVGFTDMWKLQAAFIEGSLFLPYLKRLVSEKPPRRISDKIFEIIFFVWVVCNYVGASTLSTSDLRQKMSTSLLEQTNKEPSMIASSQKSISNGVSNGDNRHSKQNGFVNNMNGDSKNEGFPPMSNGNVENEETALLDVEKNANKAFKRALVDSALNASAVIHVPQELTYLLPKKFTGDVKDSFFKGTDTADGSVNILLASAAGSVFTSYDDDFARIVGPNASAQLVTNRPGTGAFYEAGVYVPELDEVWFTNTYASYPKPGYVTAYNKRTHQFRNISQVQYGAGGYYFEGQVYIGGLTPSAGVTVTDPTTLKTSTIFNSYFGLPITLVDDLVWVKQSDTDSSYLYFTSFYNALEPGAPTPQIDRPVALPNGVWRWDPQGKTLLQVISRLDIPIPNGIRVSPDQKTLYITDSLSTPSGGTAVGDQGYAPTAGPNIYAYDLNDDMFPINKRVFGLARQGYADGIHVDDAGRVWTAEGEGIVVRSAKGKVLGVFPAGAFGMDAKKGPQIANFALAERSLFVAAFDKLWEVGLEGVVARGQT